MTTSSEKPWHLPMHPARIGADLIRRAANAGATPSERAVYVVLAGYADRKGAAWPAQVTIAAVTGASERTVRAAVQRLEMRGLLGREVPKLRARLDGATTVYRMAPQLDALPAPQHVPFSVQRAQRAEGRRTLLKAQAAKLAEIEKRAALRDRALGRERALRRAMREPVEVLGGVELPRPVEVLADGEQLVSRGALEVLGAQTAPLGGGHRQFEPDNPPAQKISETSARRRTPEPPTAGGRTLSDVMRRVTERVKRPTGS